MALDGLLRAALAGATGYLGGRGVRQQREQAEAQAAEQREYERNRQAQQDALLAQLREAQIEAQKALARDRDRPEPVTPPKTITVTGADGTLYSVDPVTRTATSVTYNGTPLRQRVPTTTPKAPAKPQVSIQKGADGTIYRINMDTGIGTPVTVNGRPVKGSVPTTGGGGFDPFGDAGAPLATQPTAPLPSLDVARGGAFAPTPGVPPATRTSSTGGTATVSPADRWEQLVNGGMSEAEATAAVKREYGLP